MTGSMASLQVADEADGSGHVGDAVVAGGSRGDQPAGEAAFVDRVAGAKDNPLHRKLSGGHFIQEDDPAGFVSAILDTAKSAGV